MLNKQNRGVSLVVLMITIIVIIILSGAIILNINQNSPIEVANEATFKSNIINYSDELDMWIAQEYTHSLGNFDADTLNSTNTTGSYNNTKIGDIIKSMKSNDLSKFAIENGELVLLCTDTIEDSWAVEVGIKTKCSEPVVSISGPSFDAVKSGNAVTYIVTFTSNIAISSINIDNIILIDKDGNIVSGVALQKDVETIDSYSKKVTLTTNKSDSPINANGEYRIKVKSGTIYDEKGVTNSESESALFIVDNTKPVPPTITATPSEGYAKQFTITITHPEQVTIKYSIDNRATWQTYSSPFTVNENLTIYAISVNYVNSASEESSLQITNIDNTSPSVVYTTSGNGYTVNVSDVGGSGVNGSSLQYIWSAQNSNAPSAGWTSFTNGDTITSTEQYGTYYLWIKATDYAGNTCSAVSEPIVITYSVSFAYTGSAQTWLIPMNGTYKIECWGAQGGNSGGKGAYVSGEINLIKDTSLYVYVGAKGHNGCNPYTSNSGDVFNGGAGGGYFTYSSYQVRGVGGGGATDVRLNSGNWNDVTGLRTRIIVAGGGGGTTGVTGGIGGTLTGGNGNKGTASTGAVAGMGGTQTAGGTSGKYAGSFGTGGKGYVYYPESPNNNMGTGGGGGYYGGGGGYGGYPIGTSAPGTNGTGGGGSSFISGYTGCNAVNSSGTATGQPNHYSGYIFTNGYMEAGVQSGDGLVKITRIS